MNKTIKIGNKIFTITTSFTNIAIMLCIAIGSYKDKITTGEGLICIILLIISMDIRQDYKFKIRGSNLKKAL